MAEHMTYLILTIGQLKLEACIASAKLVEFEGRTYKL